MGSSGTGVYDGKSGVDLRFRKLNAASARVTVTLNGQQIDIDVPLSAFELAGAVATHEAAGNPHSQYALDSDLAAHEAASDPHTGYQKESEKNAANGYAGLDGSSKLNGSQQRYGTSANTACEGNDSRLSDARQPTGAAGGALSGTYPNPGINLTSSEANVSADVTMANANQFYDGPSLSLAAGTWLIIGTITVASANNSILRATAKLWDGTTVESSTEATSPAMGTNLRGLVSLTLSGIVTLGATTTMKISAAATVASSLIKAAAVDNGAGNNASFLRAVRIA